MNKETRDLITFWKCRYDGQKGYCNKCFRTHFGETEIDWVREIKEDFLDHYSSDRNDELLDLLRYILPSPNSQQITLRIK